MILYARIGLNLCAGNHGTEKSFSCCRARRAAWGRQRDLGRIQRTHEGIPSRRGTFALYARAWKSRLAGQQNAQSSQKGAGRPAPPRCRTGRRRIRRAGSEGTSLGSIFYTVATPAPGVVGLWGYRTYRVVPVCGAPDPPSTIRLTHVSGCTCVRCRFSHRLRASLQLALRAASWFVKRFGHQARVGASGSSAASPTARLS